MLVNRTTVKCLMDDNGANIKVMADVLGIHPYTMGQKLAGVALFNEDEIKSMADYFKIDPRELVRNAKH